MTGIGIRYGSILQKSNLDFESPEDCRDGMPYLLTIHSKASVLIYMPTTKEAIIFKSSSLNLTHWFLSGRSNFRTKRMPQIPIIFISFRLVFLDKSWLWIANKAKISKKPYVFPSHFLCHLARRRPQQLKVFCSKHGTSSPQQPEEVPTLGKKFGLCRSWCLVKDRDKPFRLPCPKLHAGNSHPHD